VISFTTQVQASNLYHSITLKFSFVVEDLALYFVARYRHFFATIEKKRREGKKASCLFVPNRESNRPAADGEG